MPEEVLFESEQRQSRDQIAASLRSVVDNLEAGEPITLQAGDESVTVEPPDRPTFEVKVEQEGPIDGPQEFSLEFELEWRADEADNGDLSIE